MNEVAGGTLGVDLARALGRPDRSTSRHQLSDKLSAALLTEAGIASSPTTTVNDHVASIGRVLGLAQPCRQRSRLIKDRPGPGHRRAPLVPQTTSA